MKKDLKLLLSIALLVAIVAGSSLLYQKLGAEYGGGALITEPNAMNAQLGQNKKSINEAPALPMQEGEVINEREASEMQDDMGQSMDQHPAIEGLIVVDHQLPIPAQAPVPEGGVPVIVTAVNGGPCKVGKQGQQGNVHSRQRLPADLVFHQRTRL